MTALHCTEPHPLLLFVSFLSCENTCNINVCFPLTRFQFLFWGSVQFKNRANNFNELFLVGSVCSLTAISPPFWAVLIAPRDEVQDQQLTRRENTQTSTTSWLVFKQLELFETSKLSYWMWNTFLYRVCVWNNILESQKARMVLHGCGYRLSLGRLHAGSITNLL